MTFLECYRNGRNILEKSGIDSANFDATALFASIFNVSRQGIYLNGDKIADEETAERFFEAVKKRSEGEPLQYLLGKWEFRDLSLKVGKGVLIPREETEMLVEFALEKNIGEPMCILDLCAGSGAISIACSEEIPNAEVTAVELSDEAIVYLSENIKAYGNKVKLSMDDVLSPRNLETIPQQDIILSNPPYIPTEDLPGLQREVLREPMMALDGGADGLIFYRAILEHWLPKLKSGGWIALEFGIGETKALVEMLASAGLNEIEVRKDFSNIDRIIVAKK